MINAFSFFNPGGTKRKLPERSTDLVPSAAWAGIDTGAANFGGVLDAYSINWATNSRIAQSGSLTSIDFYMGSKPTELTALYFTVWRAIGGGNFDRVTQQDILSLVSTGAGIKSVTLPTPVDVLVNDFTGISWTGSGVVPVFLTAVAATTGNGGYYQITAPSATNHDWDAQTPLAGYVPIQCLIQATHAVFTGDSYPSGYPSYFPPADANGSIIGDTTISFSYKVSTAKGWIFENQGIGNETTTQIAARIAKVTAKKPLFVIVDGGGNDVPNAISAATTQANLVTIFDALIAAGVFRIFYILIPPFTTTTTAEAQDIDARNVSSIATCATKGVTVIDPRPIMGVFRAGGDAGNKWDLNPSYDSGDGVHPNSAGHTAMANEIIAVTGG